MNESIIHAGVVLAVSENKLTVMIVSASACSSCHAQGACLASEMKEKEIEIFRFSGNYHPGQHVNIIGRISQGYKAAFLGYFLPFLLVLAMLIFSASITENEGLIGLFSLSILIPYYLGLFIFQKKLKSSFKFEVSAIN